MARKKTKTRKRRAPLSPLELEVMDTIWDLGDCTSAQVTEAFRRKRLLAPTTIRTVMTTLRTKGFIEPIPTVGRAFVFRPKVKRETVARRSLKNLIASLFQDSPRQAIACLLEETDIPESELEEIRRKLEERRARRNEQ